MPEHFPLRLAAARMLAPTVRHLEFERADGKPFRFVPGQFIQVHFRYPDGTPTRRSYSIATVAEPGAPVGRIEIAVSYVQGGAATALFAGLRENEVIEASGPFGRFCLLEKDQNARYLLVATGTGVTPYRSMLPQLSRLLAARPLEAVLLFGARNERELLYAEDFERFAQAHPRFRFVPCLSREPRARPAPEDRRGYVQQALPDFAPDPARDIAYLCGNPNMVDACFELLRGLGFPPAQVRREKYVSSR
ncbi:MAG: FAD-binding oxidoreductase [Xanthomonadales bacterium]|nr:FAD-binding oxidoreductase [Xanthomonadales bacterium]